MQKNGRESEDQSDEKSEKSQGAIEGKSAHSKAQEAGQSHFGHIEKYGREPSRHAATAHAKRDGFWVRNIWTEEPCRSIR